MDRQNPHRTRRPPPAALRTAVLHRVRENLKFVRFQQFQRFNEAKYSSSSAKSGDKVYVDITSIFPEIGIYTEVRAATLTLYADVKRRLVQQYGYT